MKNWPPGWMPWRWTCWPRRAWTARPWTPSTWRGAGNHRGGGRLPAGSGAVRAARRPPAGALAPTILLRSDPRGERRHWAVAHEIGEFAAYRVFTQWGVDVREVAPRAREEVANRLAGRLLLPTAWFLADAASGGWDLLALKSQYATASHELIARRMLECPPPVIVTIFDHRAVSFRRSNVPGQVPPPSAAEWPVAHGPRRRLPAADRRRPADGARLAGPRARLEAGDPAGGSGRVKERGRAEGGRGKAEQRVIFSRSAAADRLRFRTDPVPPRLIASRHRGGHNGSSICPRNFAEETKA